VETDPHAVAMRMFGIALRHFRTQADLSLRELGKRCHYDYSRLSRMENGEHLGDEVLVGTIDQMLHAGGLLQALRSAAQPPSVLAGPVSVALPAWTLHVGDSDSVMMEIRMPDGRSVRVSMSRRQFGQLLTAGALPGILPAGVLDLDEAERLTLAIAQPSRIDPQVIEYFRRMLAEHYTGDKMLGPRQLLGTAMAQLDVLDTLRKQARPPVAKPLLRTLAQYAEFVGWLQQDGGDLHAAVHWSDRATQWAQSAADYQMVAYLLIRKSNIACLANDATSVVDLAAAAHDVPGGIEPRIRALAAQQEARGWAMMATPTAASANSTLQPSCYACIPVRLTRLGPSTSSTTTLTPSKNRPRPVTETSVAPRTPSLSSNARSLPCPPTCTATVDTKWPNWPMLSSPPGNPNRTEPPNLGWPASNSPVTLDQRASARSCTLSTGHSWPGGLTSLAPAPSTTPLRELSLDPRDPGGQHHWTDDGGNIAGALTVSSSVESSGTLSRLTAARVVRLRFTPCTQATGTRRP
jgi:Helix-turn-helix domain